MHVLVYVRLATCIIVQRTLASTLWGETLRFPLTADEADDYSEDEDGEKEADDDDEDRDFEELEDFGVIVGEGVHWVRHDHDLPLGTTGTVVSLTENDRVSVKFPNGVWTFLPHELRKGKASIRERFGFALGETVRCTESDDELPEGSTGTIVDFTADHVVVNFQGVSRTFHPTHLHNLKAWKVAKEKAAGAAPLSQHPDGRLLRRESQTSMLELTEQEDKATSLGDDGRPRSKPTEQDYDYDEEDPRIKQKRRPCPLKASYAEQIDNSKRHTWPRFISDLIGYAIGTYKDAVPPVASLTPGPEAIAPAPHSEVGLDHADCSDGDAPFEEDLEASIADDEYEAFTDPTLAFTEDAQRHQDVFKSFKASDAILKTATSTWACGGTLRMNECVERAMEGLDLAMKPQDQEGYDDIWLRLDHWSDEAIDELFDMEMDVGAGKGTIMGGKGKGVIPDPIPYDDWGYNEVPPDFEPYTNG